MAMAVAGYSIPPLAPDKAPEMGLFCCLSAFYQAFGWLSWAAFYPVQALFYGTIAPRVRQT